MSSVSSIWRMAAPEVSTRSPRAPLVEMVRTPTWKGISRERRIPKSVGKTLQVRVTGGEPMVCYGAKWGGVGLLPSSVLGLRLLDSEQAHSSTVDLPEEGQRDHMAFRGTYEHTVDDRGRVAVPARYRHEFAGGVVLARSPDGCVEVYTPEGYDEMSNLVTAEPAVHLKGRRLRRGVFADSWDAGLDRQGRILIPAPR